MQHTVTDGSHTIKRLFSRTTSIEKHIHSEPKIVWDILTNGDKYTYWNSTITFFEGNIEQGQTIKLKSYLDKKRIFKLIIREFIPNQKLVWGDKMGQRTFLLRPVDDGVIFSMSETIGGPFFPLFAKMIPPFDESFEKFAHDLEKEATKPII